MTEAEVRRIVAAMLGVTDGEKITLVGVQGNVSHKDIGELVGRAGLHCKYVVVDVSHARTIAGHRPWWRPGKAKG